MRDGSKARFSTPKEIAELLEVHEKTVRRWCVRGEVDAELTPSGAQWRIRVKHDGFPVRPG